MKPTRARLVNAATALVVVGLFMIVATPALDDLDAADRAWSIVRLAERVQIAARRHHADTGRFAVEFAAPNAEHEFTSKRFHELSAPQFFDGWKGPYLDHALTQADNPFMGAVLLHRDFDVAPAQGFEFGPTDAGHGPGNWLLLEDVPEDVARLVDQHIDGTQNASSWASDGRVEYHAEARRAICIHLTR